MTPTPTQLQKLALLLEHEWETPEAAARALIVKWNEMQGEKPAYAAVITIPGLMPQVVGHYSTPKQAEKGAVLAGSSYGGKAYLAQARTPEGLAAHLAKVDEKAPAKGDYAEIALDAQARKNGWRGKASARGEFL